MFVRSFACDFVVWLVCLVLVWVSHTDRDNTHNTTHVRTTHECVVHDTMHFSYDYV